jgi:hypothetical protein
MLSTVIIITGLHEMEVGGQTHAGAERGGKDGARQGQNNWWRRTTSLPSSLNKQKHSFLQVILK